VTDRHLLSLGALLAAKDWWESTARSSGLCRQVRRATGEKLELGHVSSGLGYLQRSLPPVIDVLGEAGLTDVAAELRLLLRRGRGLSP
jgi:hypothetical protein